MKLKLLRREIHYERDVVLARQRARTVAAALKFDVQAQTRLATAVSEIARRVDRLYAELNDKADFLQRASELL